MLVGHYDFRKSLWDCVGAHAASHNYFVWVSISVPEVMNYQVLADGLWVTFWLLIYTQYLSYVDFIDGLFG